MRCQSQREQPQRAFGEGVAGGRPWLALEQEGRQQKRKPPEVGNTRGWSRIGGAGPVGAHGRPEWARQYGLWEASLKTEREIGELYHLAYFTSHASWSKVVIVLSVSHVGTWMLGDSWGWLTSWALLEGWQPRILSVCLRTCQEFNILCNLLNFEKETF